jgi:hypothetical protein
MKLVWSQNQILPLTKLQKWLWMMATQKSIPIYNNEFENLVATMVDNNGRSRSLK